MSSLIQGKDSGSLRARVFATLERDILNGEYKEGDTLNELKLSQTLGVSRTPIREALMQLELEGLVETIQNKGAIVVGISTQDIEDIYAIRLHLEGFATSLAAEKMTDDEVTALEKVLELQEFYMTKNDTDRIWELDAEFHRMLYSASDNRTLKTMLSSLHNQIQRGRVLSLRVEGRAEKSVEEHRRIVEAIKARDAGLAEQLTIEHINNALKNFRMEVE